MDLYEVSYGRWLGFGESSSASDILLTIFGLIAAHKAQPGGEGIDCRACTSTRGQCCGMPLPGHLIGIDWTGVPGTPIARDPTRTPSVPRCMIHDGTRAQC